MAEYWLISAPGDKTPQQTYINLKGRMTGLSPVFQLNLPELKVCNVIFIQFLNSAPYLYFVETLKTIES